MTPVVSVATVLTRRKTLAWFTGAVMTGIAVWFIRPLSPVGVFSRLPSFKPDDIFFDAGKTEHYKIGKVDRRWKNKYGVWLIRTLDGFYALSAKTASGGDTEWDENLKYFREVSRPNYFYRSGVHFKGTEKASLLRVAVRQTEDGRLWVGRENRNVLTTHTPLPV